MEKDLRLAILGTGHMAQSFAIAMETVPGVALAGFCSRDRERAKTFSTYFGAMNPTKMKVWIDAVDGERKSKAWTTDAISVAAA